MDRRIRSHRVQISDLVGLLPEMREEIGDVFTALTVLFELPFGTNHTATVFLTATPKGFHLNGLAV